MLGTPWTGEEVASGQGKERKQAITRTNAGCLVLLHHLSIFVSAQQQLAAEGGKLFVALQNRTFMRSNGNAAYNLRRFYTLTARSRFNFLP